MEEELSFYNKKADHLYHLVVAVCRIRIISPMLISKFSGETEENIKFIKEVLNSK